MSRYARQRMLPEIGQDGQDRLRRAHVLVVGAGGLGCPVLAYLVGAGVGHVSIIDPDVVELGNLHRQPLFTMPDIGRAKAEVAAERLGLSNPDIDIRSMPVALDPANAVDLVKASDLVVDAADSFAVSYTLSDICLTHHVPLVSASVLGHCGYVGGFCDRVPSLRAVFPDLPQSAANCASAGVSGPVVGMIGAMQAQLAVLILAGQNRIMGRLTTVDMVNGQFGGFDFHSATEPDAVIPFVAPSQCRPCDRIVDLRGKAQAAMDHLGPPDDQRIVLCCVSGLRAWNAALKLQQRGYDNLALLAAGRKA